MDRTLKRMVFVAAFFTLSLSGIWSARGQGFGLSSPEPQAMPEEKVLSSGAGRYVFGQISSSTKDQFMLDTLTGRLWRVAESGDVGIYLRSVPYRSDDGKCSPVPEEGSKGAPKRGERR